MSKIKVLLVDDEEAYVKTLAERMEMRDVGSRVALSGEEALQMLEDEPPDVMVLDLRMPGIDGMEVLERVKQQHPQIEVIILTGHGSDREENEARRLGAFEYLQKPADTGHLLKTVRAAWRKSLKAAAEFIKDSQEEFEGSMAAAAFAEAGAPEIAREAMQESARRGSESAAEPGAEETDTGVQTLKVLFVDDEEDFVRTMAERMEMREVDSEVALDGQQALQMLEDEVPDVMVLDLRMPGIDGLEVLRQVKKMYPEMEVIIMTGHGSEADEAEARRLGAFEYLSKPVDINRLMEVVREAGRSRRKME
ncbi:MAG: response regulator [Gemmatimonadales bacterium]|jgi:DNA-binding NtrC family response regulator